MTDPIPLRLLQDEAYVYLDNLDEVEHIAEQVGIPEEFIEDITGCVVWAIDGDYEEVYFTESSRPFDLDVTYYTPDYWIDDEEEVWND